MSVLFLQTAEVTYRPLLEISSRTVLEYCSRHRHSYDCFFGIVRGYHPWQASFNRIPLLKRLLDSGFAEWACYLDADAYIADLEFDLRGYLADKSEFAVIAAPGGRPPRWWDINAGVLLLNFAHPVARAIVQQWSARFNAISDEQLRAAEAWHAIVTDQGMLHQLLQEIPDGERYMLIEDGAPGLLNYRGRFIRQVLRAPFATFDDRLDYLRSEVERVVGPTGLAHRPT